MNQLTVRCLGGLEIRLDDRQIADFESHKVKALFAYLIVQRDRSFSREHLATLLWPEKSSVASRRNLRQAVYNLKSVLGASQTGSSLILATSSELRFDPDIDCWLDVDAFAEAHSRGVSREAIVPHYLTRAAALYRGDFLAGFALKDSPDFELWQLAEQERRREQAIDTLRTLIESYLARGEFRLGIQYSRRLVAIDPLSEQAHQYLIQLYSLSGQRSRALAEYEQLRQTLRRELGVEPLEKTQQLCQNILSEESSAPREEETIGIGPVVPLVGRHEPYLQLRECWQSVLAQRPRLTIVEGEAGIGKTRLVKSFLDATHSQHLMTILKGKCSERIPTGYQPFAEVLRNAASEDSGRARAALEQTSAEELAILELLVPELSELSSQAPEPEVQGRLERDRLFECIAAFLERLCRPGGGDTSCQPLVLLLADLQWAHDETVELIEYLLEWLTAMPVWILGIRCPGRFGKEPAALCQLRPTDQRVDVSRIVLGRLLPEAIAELAAALVDDLQANELSDFLMQHSEGLPVAVTEWINSLWDQRILVHDAGRWHLRESLRDRSGNLAELLQARSRRLPTSTHRLASQAAIIGQTFDARLLQEAAEEHPKVVEVGLELMLERWMIRQHSDHWMTGRREHDIVLWAKGARLGSFAFNHRLIWQAILEDVDPLRRQVLHKEVARTLEKSFGEDTEGLCERLAFHYTQACIWDRAVVYLRQAVSRARAVSAAGTARHYLRQTVEVLDRLAAAARAPDDAQPWLAERERALVQLAELE